MSGTADDAGVTPESLSGRVWRVLNREESIGALDELRNGLGPIQRELTEGDQPIALGFDTSAIFRLGLGQQGADALDYLRALHEGPLIVPGQAIQELWNNQLSGLQPKAMSLRQQFEKLAKEADGIGVQLGDAGESVAAAISQLMSEHGEWVDSKTQNTLDETLQVLLSAAVVRYVPRAKFGPLAHIRRETKTPPGFKDTSGYGDFFVWADFLRGLAEADPTKYRSVAFVTNDEKSDWSRNQVPHPVLVAEAVTLAGRPFRLWNLDQFRAFVRSATSA